MNRLKHTAALLCILCLIPITGQATTKVIGQVTSPDGRNTFTLYMQSTGALLYRVERDSQLMVDSSCIGFKTSTADYTTFTTREAYITTATQEIQESYQLPTGKCSTYQNHCNQLTVTLRKGSVKPQIVIRAYNDGVAFRYVLPTTGDITVTQDIATAVIPGFRRSFGQKYSSDYSQVYLPRDWTETLAVDGGRFAAPVLVETTLGTDYNLLLTEAEVNEQFCGSPLYPQSAVTGTFAWQMIGNATASGITVKKPYTMPWRVIYMGPETSFVESTLIDNLCTPTTLTDLSWIRAGLSSWDWGGEEGGGLKNRTDWDVARQYIDFAVSMGWPYFTLDEGWSSSTLGDGTTSADYCQAITAYAAQKGIKCFIWRNQSGVPSTESDIRTTLQQWKDWGFVGAKIDFFSGDSQSNMQKMERILRVAASLQFMINFHGCPKPTGLRRTWPNFVTCEAVDGNEDYFTGGWNLTGTDPDYNITLALTRNVVGPMDYTPFEFIKGKNGSHRDNTTWGHQIALGVIYESGIQTVSDAPENILNQLNSNVRDMLKQMPARWDETVCTQAAAHDHICVARRDSTDWWIGYASVAAGKAQINLDFLPEGAKYRAQIYTDGSTFDTFTYLRRTNLSSLSTLSVPVLAGGGCVIHLVQTSAPDGLTQVLPDDSLPDIHNTSVYDLAGRKVTTDTLPSGILIAGGKKFLVRK